MIKRVFLLACVTCLFALPALPVQAQEWSAEQLEVWKVISKVWEMEKAGDHSWADMLHDSYQSWPYESLIPMSKTATTRWLMAEEGHFKILEQYLSPVGIVVVGDTAVVHYFHMTLTEWDDGERETSDGRATDVLTRTKDGWRIVSWVGDELAEDQDD